MKSFIVCALVCLMGCGAAPNSNENQVTGSTSPVTGGGGGGYPNAGGDNSLDCGGYHWVVVWENGVSTPQLQPILCNEGPNFDVGDPGPDRGDPNPWENNVVPSKVAPILKTDSPTKM